MTTVDDTSDKAPLLVAAVLWLQTLAKIVWKKKSQIINISEEINHP